VIASSGRALATVMHTDLCEHLLRWSNSPPAGPKPGPQNGRSYDRRS